MSNQNVEVVQRWIDAFNEGGLDAVMDEFWHEQIELFDPPSLPDAGRHVGKAAVRERVQGFIEFGWDERFRVDELIAVGDEVVMPMHILGRSPAGDMPLDFNWVFVVYVEDGKLRRIRQYLTKEEGLEAAGLSD